MWALGMVTEMETQLWLSANPDGSTKTKLRLIALLEIHLKVTESAAADQHADHIIALVQEQQVGFRVRDGAEAMISAERENS